MSVKELTVGIYNLYVRKVFYVVWRKEWASLTFHQ